MKRSELFFNVLLIPVDIIMLLLAGCLVYQLRISEHILYFRPVMFLMSFTNFMEMVLLSSPVFVLLFGLLGLYNLRSVRKFWAEIMRVILAVSMVFMLVVLIIFFLQTVFPSRFIFVTMWFCVICTVSTGRVIVRYIQGYVAKKYNFGFHRLVLVGETETSKSIQLEVKKNRVLGYKIIRKLKNVDLVLLDKIFQESGVDEIILCTSEIPKNEMQQLLDFCQQRDILFKFVPDVFQSQAALFEMETISDITLIEVKRTPLDGWGKIWKRLFDIIISLVVFILFFPIFVVLALLIKLDSSGPVLVRLNRVGKDRVFGLYKFRSMVNNAHQLKYNADGTLTKEFKELNERQEGPLFKIKNDPRITRFGKFLRRTRLDEFPQLINVIKGEMSLVGPRPHEPEEVANYKKCHQKLFTICPGVTGMAQVSGSSDLSFDKEVKLDIYYIENWSLALDVIILVKTALIFIKGDKSAC